MDSIQYLDRAKSHLGLTSDYALAKALKVGTSTISNYRAGRSRIDDDMAMRLAHVLGINPLEPIAAANAERAKSPELRDMWESIMQKVALGFDLIMLRAAPRLGI